MVREHTASMHGSQTFERMWFDLRYAFRQLRRAPGFALTVVTTLALAIGANLAVFQLLYGVMLAHLPVQQPDQLYSLHALKSPFDGQWFFSYPAYQRLRQASGSSAPVISRSGLEEATLQASDGSAERVNFQFVSGNFFSVLGVHPFAGRLFADRDDEPGQNEWPAVVTYQYAQEHFGLDRSVVGRRFVLNGVPVVIAGIAPERFYGVMRGFAPDLWLPLEAQASGQLGAWFDSLGPGFGIHLNEPWQNQPGIFWLWLLARMPDADKPATPARWTAALQPDLQLIAAASKDAHVREQTLAAKVQLVSASSGEGAFFKRYTPPLILLMAMASVIFLVGCLNLANLQLARLSSRYREIAIRISLGATRWRVMRQILIENLLLALLGGVFAFATGRAASAVLLHWASGRDWTIALDLHVNAYMVLLGAGLLICSMVLFSVWPAWWITRSNFAAASGSRQITPGLNSGATNKSSSILLAGQVCFSLLLVGMAYMFGQTLLSVDHIDAGMDREHVISVHLDTARFAKGRQDDLPALYRQMRERLKSLPGVTNAAVQMCSIPGCGWNTALHVFGRPEMADAQMHGEENHIGTGYFRTLGIPLLRGRDFSDDDRTNTEPVAIINQAYARKLFGEENPVGHWIGYRPAPDDHQFLIVGEAADTRVDGLRSPAPPVVYIPVSQHSDVIHTIEVRASGRPETIARQVRQAIHELAPDLPVKEIVTLNTEFEDGLATEKLLARLTAVFGSLTLTLAALGFYGLLSFRVSRRTFEIGIRIVLGATRLHIQMLVLRQTLMILLVGILPGIVLTSIAGHLAQSVLYGAGKASLLAMLFAAAALAIVGVVATFLPARHAASVNAIEAIRTE